MQVSENKEKIEFKIKNMCDSLKAVYVLFLIVVLLSLVAVIIHLFTANKETLFEGERLINFEEGWQDDDEKAINLKDIIKLMRSEGVRSKTISRKLPANIENNEYLMFKSKHLHFSVYIDGKEIYTYNKKPKASFIVGQSYGHVFHAINLKKDSSAKELRMKIEEIYKDAGSIDLVYFGESGTYIMKVMEKIFSRFLVSVLILILGIFFLIISFGITNADKNLLKGLRSFAILITVGGLWSGIETSFLQLLIGNFGFFRASTYPLMMSVPLFLIPTVNYLASKPIKRVSMYSYIFVGIEYLICLVLYLLKGYDLHQSQLIIHIGLISSFIFVIIIMIRNFIYDYKNKKKYFDFILFIGIAVQFTFIFLDVILYYLKFGDVSIAKYTKIGTLGMVIFFFIYIFQKITGEIKKTTQIEMYMKLAYIDGLTKLGNRTAYELREKEVIKDINEGKYREVLIFYADLNSLKFINDNLGHAIGDQYIIKSTDILKEIFSPKNPIYRIGGDEFISLIPGNNVEKDIINYTKKLNEKTREKLILDDYCIDISIAYGWAIWRGEKDQTLEQASVKADKNMYKMKEKMKEEKKKIIRKR